MKTLSRLFALTSVSLLTTLIPASHAAPRSPAGEWDFVVTGKQRGVALISFNSDFTLFGTEIVRGSPPAGSSSSTGDARNPSGTTASRNSPSTSTNASITSTNFYGSADLTGFWAYDSAGRILGTILETYYTLETVTTLQTNDNNGTNEVTSVTAPEWVPHTSGMSFRGTVSANLKKLTINAYTPRGLSTFKGVEMGSLPDYSGDYYSVATKERPYVEFFSASANGLASSGYDVQNGTGAGYVFDGNMLVSKQKQVALLTLTDSGFLTAVTGAYKTNRFTGANAITGDLRGTAGTYRNFLYKLAPRR